MIASTSVKFNFYTTFMEDVLANRWSNRQRWVSVIKQAAFQACYFLLVGNKLFKVKLLFLLDFSVEWEKFPTVRFQAEWTNMDGFISFKTCDVCLKAFRMKFMLALIAHPFKDIIVKRFIADKAVIRIFIFNWIHFFKFLAFVCFLFLFHFVSLLALDIKREKEK